MPCYGVCNSSPDTVASTLISWGVIESVDDIYVLPFYTLLKEERVGDAKVVFLPTISDLYRNTDLLNESYGDTIVVAFGNPIRMREVEGITFLDIVAQVKNDAAVSLAHSIQRSRFNQGLKAKLPPIRRKRDVYLFSLMETRKGGKLLSPLITAVNCMNARAQLKMLEAVCDTVRKNKSPKYLRGVVRSLQEEGHAGEGTLSKKWIGKFLRVIEGEVGQAVKDIFIKIEQMKEEGKAAPTKSMAERAGIKAHELRYLRKIIDNIMEKNGESKETVNQEG